MTSAPKRNLGFVLQGASFLRQAREHPGGANEGYLAVHNVVARALHGQGGDISFSLSEAVVGAKLATCADGAG